NGQPIFTHTYHQNSILAARRFRDGSIAYVSYSGHYVRLDRTGKQAHSHQLNWAGFGLNGADILPGDRVVASVSNYNKVVEYGPDLKPAWECQIIAPSIPHRLANGNTVLAGNSNTEIYEIDRRGKVVKTLKGLSFKPYRVTKR